MKRFFSIIFLINILGFIYSQDTIVNLKSYKTIPENWYDRDSLIKIVMTQHKLDYWEYRLGFDTDINDCPFDSIGCINSIKYDHRIDYKGKYRDLDDSIQLSKINCKSGLWILPPGGGYYYIVYKSKNHIDSILNIDTFMDFIKPIKTPEQAALYLNLDSYILHDSFKINSNNYEFIVLDKDFKDSKSGDKVLLTYTKYYIKIYFDGKIYKKKSGEYKTKIDKFRLT